MLWTAKYDWYSTQTLWVLISDHRWRGHFIAIATSTVYLNLPFGQRWQLAVTRTVVTLDLRRPCFVLGQSKLQDHGCRILPPSRVVVPRGYAHTLSLRLFTKQIKNNVNFQCHHQSFATNIDISESSIAHQFINGRLLIAIYHLIKTPWLIVLFISRRSIHVGFPCVSGYKL